MLSDPDVERFSRHILLREVGGVGQERLLRACVRLTRLDAEGRACALWLARSGIGALDLPADDSPAPTVDPSGLLLAIDAGQPVVRVVRERLLGHFPALAFRAGATCEAGAAGGAAAALAVVKSIVLPGGRAS